MPQTQGYFGESIIGMPLDALQSHINNRHGQSKPISPQSLRLTPTKDSGVESLMEHLITMDVVETIACER